MSGLLRICTAGSVDDGKSTLIGRLLYDSKQVFEDQLAHVAHASARRGGEGTLDLALLTDGLWLRNAAHANAMATRLAVGLAGIPGGKAG